jgi:type I restriction enzyme S subunit
MGGVSMFLSDLVDVIGGGTPKTTEESYWNGSIPWLSVKDFCGDKKYVYNTEKCITEEGLNNSSTKLLHKDNIIISARGTVGELAMIPYDMAFNQSCFGLIPKGNNDPHFVYYLLKDKVRSLKSQTQGSVFDTITKATFDRIECADYSEENQRRIATILSSLDRKIELNNKINADLEEMAQAIFKNWFVDFEPFKDGKFVDSELGMIPEGWKVGRLTDVIKLMPGGTPKTSEPLYWDNGTIPFFSPKDVNGVYCFATEKHITETGLNKCSSNLYPKDTIFITCRGTVGKVCLAACDMAMNQSNYAIKAIDGYSQYYVFFLVKSVVERLIKKSNGAVFSAITSKDFDEEILIPSQKAVEDFTNMIDGFFRRIFTIGTENSRLSLLRDTLLPRLISGEIEVPE